MTSPEEKIILNANPKKALEGVHNIIDRLHVVYTAETHALENSDARAFMALQEEKISAARDYQDAIEQLVSRKDEFVAADPALKTSLTEKQQLFSELSRRNLAALERMQKSMTRFGDTLRNAVKDIAIRQRSSSYTSLGTMAAEEAKRISSGSISQTA